MSVPVEIDAVPIERLREAFATFGAWLFATTPEQDGAIELDEDLLDLTAMALGVHEARRVVPLLEACDPEWLAEALPPAVAPDFAESARRIRKDWRDPAAFEPMYVAMLNPKPEFFERVERRLQRRVSTLVPEPADPRAVVAIGDEISLFTGIVAWKLHAALVRAPEVSLVEVSKLRVAGGPSIPDAASAVRLLPTFFAIARIEAALPQMAVPTADAAAEARIVLLSLLARVSGRKDPFLVQSAYEGVARAMAFGWPPKPADRDVAGWWTGTVEAARHTAARFGR